MTPDRGDTIYLARNQLPHIPTFHRERPSPKFKYLVNPGRSGLTPNQPGLRLRGASSDRFCSSSPKHSRNENAPQRGLVIAFTVRAGHFSYRSQARLSLRRVCIRLCDCFAKPYNAARALAALSVNTITKLSKIKKAGQPHPRRRRLTRSGGFLCHEQGDEPSTHTLVKTLSMR